MARGGYSASNCLRLGASPVATPFTVAGWGVLPALSAGGVRTLFFYGNSGATGAADSHELRLDATDHVDAQSNTAAGASASATSTTTVPTANVWFHACGIFASATDRRVFLNGGGKGTDATNRAPTTINRLSLGLRDNVSNTNPFGGSLAHFALWSVALADADVAALAAGADPRHVRPDVLAAYWPLFGNYSPEINLLSNANGLTLVGSPTLALDPPLIHMRSRRGVLNV